MLFRYPLLAIFGLLSRWKSSCGGSLKTLSWLTKHRRSSLKCAVGRAEQFHVFRTNPLPRGKSLSNHFGPQFSNVLLIRLSSRSPSPPPPSTSFPLLLSPRKPCRRVIDLSRRHHLPPPPPSLAHGLNHTRQTLNYSGGTIASLLDVCEKVWTQGSALVKKMDDPLLLVTQPADGGVTFKKAGSPGGFGYDSAEKCEQTSGKPC